MIHILGTGSMGCLWAAHLSHSTSICFISRKPIANKNKQFTLHSPLKKTNLHYQIPTLSAQEILAQDSSNTINTLLVCTKSYDTLSALNQLKPKLSEQCLIVLFQNGLGSQYDVLKAFPKNPIFAAVSTEGANKKSENDFIHAGVGETKLGLLTKTDQPLLDHCHKQLTASKLIVHQHPDIWQALWTKLVINCAINPFTALLDCQNGNVQQHDYFKQHWPALRHELCRLLITANFPLSEAELEQHVFNVMSKTHNNISSMLQDIRKQRPTEIDHINGFSYRYLEQHAQPYQTNKLLWESVNALRD